MPCSLRQLDRRLAEIESRLRVLRTGITPAMRLLVTGLLAVLPACSSLPAPRPEGSRPAPAARDEIVLPDAVFVAPDSRDPRPSAGGEHGDAAGAELAAAALIAAERQAAINGDLELLAALWAPDGRIVDGRGTEDPADDYVWQGRDAILDRYALAVLPAPPPALAPGTLDRLTVVPVPGYAGNAGTSSDATVSVELGGPRVGGDRWTLSRQDGRWWLAELRYN